MLWMLFRQQAAGKMKILFTLLFIAAAPGSYEGLSPIKNVVIQKIEPNIHQDTLVNMIHKMQYKKLPIVVSFECPFAMDEFSMDYVPKDAPETKVPSFDEVFDEDYSPERSEDCDCPCDLPCECNWADNYNWPDWEDCLCPCELPCACKGKEELAKKGCCP